MYRLRNPALLRSLMETAGLTAQQLADRVVKADGSHPSRQLIEHLMSGRRHGRATPAIARSIAEALRVHVDVLWMPAGPRTTSTDAPHPEQPDRPGRGEETPE